MFKNFNTNNTGSENFSKEINELELKGWKVVHIGTGTERDSDGNLMHFPTVVVENKNIKYDNTPITYKFIGTTKESEKIIKEM